LGVKIPDMDDPRVTIWDLEDTTVIAQKVISAVDGVATFDALTSNVDLYTGKKYAVTVYSNDYYFRIRTGGVSYPYPVTEGNVTISKFIYAGRPDGAPAIYPENEEGNYISGLQDFTFRTQD
jgi:hypothetical protein